jgi:hypothetical protein
MQSTKLVIHLTKSRRFELMVSWWNWKLINGTAGIATGLTKSITRTVTNPTAKHYL